MEGKGRPQTPERRFPAQHIIDCRIHSPILTAVLLGQENLVAWRRSPPPEECRPPRPASSDEARAPAQEPAPHRPAEEKVPSGQQQAQAPEGNRENNFQPPMRFSGAATGRRTPVSGENHAPNAVPPLCHPHSVVMRPVVLRPAPYPVMTWFPGCSCCCCSYAAATAARGALPTALHYQENLAQRRMVQRHGMDIPNAYGEREAHCRGLEMFEGGMFEYQSGFQDL